MMPPFSFFLWISTLLLSSFMLYLLLYRRRSSHGPPLPPGPAGWPILGNLPQLGRKPHQTLHALSKRYGPLFRLRLGSVDVVVASSSSVAAQFLRTHDANFSNRPPTSGAEHVAYNYQDLVFAPYGARWRMLRKLCAVHLFSMKALEDLRPVRQDEVAILVRNLGRHADKGVVVNLGKALYVCASNTLARLMIGRRVFADEDVQLAEAHEFQEMFAELMRLGGVFNVGDFVPGIGWLDLQGVVGKMKRMHIRYDTFLNRIIEEHQTYTNDGKSNGGTMDLLSVMMRLKEGSSDAEGEIKLNNTDIKALLLNLFTAGSDPSASTVEWALAELIRQPDIVRKTRQELDSVVGRDRLVAESDLPKLPYLQAVIKETFRLHPSSPLSLPRMSSEECTVGGFTIPKHATLLVNVWSIGRDPLVWDDPLQFRPSRFLPGGEREHVDIKGNDFEVIPFGAGRRICPGMSLGLRMIQFMTATIVHAYDWSLPEGEECGKLDMEEAYGLTVQRAVPLMLQPIPRLSEKAYQATRR